MVVFRADLVCLKIEHCSKPSVELLLCKGTPLPCVKCLTLFPKVGFAGAHEHKSHALHFNTAHMYSQSQLVRACH